jgi:hypothetical protein
MLYDMAFAHLKLPLQLLPEENKENYPLFIKCSIIKEMLQQGLYFKCSSEVFVTVTYCDLMTIKDCVLRPLCGFCPLRGLNPGLLLAFSLDIIP